MPPQRSKPLTTKQATSIRATYDLVFNEARARGFALETRRTYAMRARHFAQWLCGRDRTRLPDDPAGKIRAFLLALAAGEVTGRKVGPVTINQSRHALLFFYQKARGEVVADIGAIPTAKRPQLRPPVLSRAQVDAILAAISDGPWMPYRLMARLLYYTGGRICDVLRLRIKDLDWANSEVLFRCGKGAKDRRSLLPCAVMTDLRAQVTRSRRMWEVDAAAGAPTSLPECVWNKAPRYGRAWGWAYVFPAVLRTKHPDHGHTCRHHCLPKSLQDAVAKAAARCGFEGMFTPHSFRHAYAQELLRDGVDLRAVQVLLGHEHLDTTAIYTEPELRSSRVRDAVNRLATA